MSCELDLTSLNLMYNRDGDPDVGWDICWFDNSRTWGLIRFDGQWWFYRNADQPNDFNWSAKAYTDTSWMTGPLQIGSAEQAATVLGLMGVLL